MVGTETGLFGHTGVSLISGVSSSLRSAGPDGFALEANYPNPFNPSTVISYQLPRATKVTISVYNLLGELVAVLVDKSQESGSHQVRFEASHLPNGVYFYRVVAGDFMATRKMVLIK